MAIAKSTFTGLTAEIQFGGLTVGRLQDFAFTENSDMIPVRAIGSGVNVALVPTVKQYQITASRAFMYGDLFISLLSTVPIEALAKAGISLDQISLGEKASANISADSLKTLFTLGESDITMFENSKAAQIYFDIMVNNSSGDDLYRFTNCLMTSRNTRISATGVVVLENVSLVSLNRVIGTAYEVKEGLPTS